MKRNNLSTCFLTLFTILVLTPGYLKAQSIVATLEKSFPRINNVLVEGDYCKVEVTGTTTSEVKFKGEIRSSDHFYLNIHHSVNGGTLKIWVDHPKSNPGRTSGSLILMVPSRTNVTINNANGSALIQNLSGSTYKLTSTLGKLTAKNISSGLNAQTTSGSINVNGLRGDLVATTRMGNQNFTDITGKITAKAENGDITASGINGNLNITTTLGKQSFSRVTGHVTAEAKEGSLTFNGITGNVKATTESGTMDLNQTSGSLQLVSITGSQSGKGIRLTSDSSFESSSGTINMQISNAKEKLSFYLTATSGHLKAKGSVGRRNLVVDNGGIRITGKTASGSQTYY